MFENIKDFNGNFNWVAQVDANNFETAALTVFRFQAEKNPVYRSYLHAIGVNPESVNNYLDIPFLPISFFKTHKVLCEGFEAPLYFESSGTTATGNSRHYLPRPELYETCFRYYFERFYGQPEAYVFLCLLPNYLERSHSSLVYMAKDLIGKSGHPESAFYLHDFQRLAETLSTVTSKGKKAILLGVTFALLDFADAYPMDLSSVIVMETGGMKGRREEWTRAQVHNYLKERWQLPSVHSEYGMTELCSQAYADADGLYRAKGLMRVSVRDETDPLSNAVTGKGCLNIIDLGNLYSCAFIATDDLGVVHTDGRFEVRGRVDYAALRGCSLMVV